MPNIEKTYSVAKQAANIATPALKQAISSAATKVSSDTALDLKGDVFARLRPVADKMMRLGNQAYGANMASVAQDLTLSPAHRAAAFRARHQSDLSGRTGLVTGAAGNIGAETAFMMASNKMKVMLTDIPRANLDNVAETCELLGAEQVVVSKHDLTTDEGRSNLVDKTLSEVGSPFATVLCAGLYFEGGLWDHNPEKRATRAQHYELANKVNVQSPVALAEAFVPHVNPGAHMLVVNSLAGETGVKGESLYVGTKFALDGIWSTMAKDFSHLGIKFEQVFPSALLGKMAEGRPGLEAELLHFPMAVVRAIETALKTQGNSYLPRIRVSGAISPYAADHG